MIRVEKCFNDLPVEGIVIIMNRHGVQLITDS